jgi:uncharacterized protein
MSINPDKSIKTVCDVNPQQLLDEGISTIVLDYDGVLASYRREMPDEVVVWLSKCVKIFGLSQIFILTNNPSKNRVKYFDLICPGIQVIDGVKKKPDPEGLNQIIKLVGVNPEQVMMFDDQLSSGILAARRAGTKSTLITKPYIGLDIRELWWVLLRFVERLVNNRK